MQITPFQAEFIPEAADLFVNNFKQLRQQIPILPDSMENHDRIIERFAYLPDDYPGVAALENGKLIGYLRAFLVDGFRSTHRKGAYCPVWAHGAKEDARSAIYRALYRAAAEQWTAAGCRVHAISLLAHDHAAEKIWFWNGFGLGMVDGIRSLDAVQGVPSSTFSVRQATLQDVDALLQIEDEHWRHYAQPPIFMASDGRRDADSFRKLLTTGHNSIWLAHRDSTIMSYLQFEESGHGATEIVVADTTIAITGAYTRPAYRGQGAAKSILNTALHHYAGLDFERCSVDFESFNPEAAIFWMKHFEPVSLSVMRVPECVREPLN